MSREQKLNPLDTAAWSEIAAHAAGNSGLHLRDLLAEDVERYQRFSILLDELLVDYSRNLVTDETMSLLTRLAEQVELQDRIAELFAGAIVNQTEERAALHSALRGSSNASVQETVANELDHFLTFADEVRSGTRRSFTGKQFERVVNIGIGGSDLGPRLVVDALAEAGSNLTVHFVAGIDGIELRKALEDADAEKTLFIVCSKTFTTLETRANADAARGWLLASQPEGAIGAQFVAISVNDSAMDAFGIAADARFSIWDWVGGRFSLWSAIGLSAAIALGSDGFRQLLAGAATMDEHFKHAPLKQNIPVLLGLLSVWNQNFLGIQSHVILPYDQRLELLPAYLQQLFMESLGKSTRLDQKSVEYHTGCAVWGGAGSPAQHSFAQLLHQGTARAQVDYIGIVNAPAPDLAAGFLLALANLVAQAESLATGHIESEVAAALSSSGATEDDIIRLTPHKVHPGNRPANIILLRELNPYTLGMLLAMYEHQVFVQGAIWGINPFDQWGVELGKIRATAYARHLAEADAEKLPGIGQQIFRWTA
jgi:glucose-6-phosphate isomerase